MRTPDVIALCLLAALATPATAQEATAEDETTTEEMAEEMADEVMEDMAEEMSEETSEDMAEGTTEEMAEEMTEEMADEASDTETPSLEEIAAEDPALDVRTNEDGEVDAMVMLSDVLFAFGDASLAPAALDVLAGIGEKLDGVSSIEITGHTDAVGDDDFNLGLGQRRADSVRDWLIANTPLTAEVITATSAGESDPVADNGTSEGRALNRRVEFTLPDEG